MKYKNKGISLFYNFLHQKSTFTKTLSMKTWERDLMAPYTPDQLKFAITSIYQATKSANLWELNQKILLRWFLTPTRLVGFNLQLSPLCQRQCSQRGSMIHIFWACPLLRTYWFDIFNLIGQITSSQPLKNMSMENLFGNRHYPSSFKEHRLPHSHKCTIVTSKALEKN